ncbi:dihydrofolate reductase [Arachidicoccus soli]|uniref:Dihydrofolate reductase n=1 Tax=Arachidicoccus soli TaxID=2341117 RepID=A0A386HRY3_9BACT|nr:dihydrofolate reductase [Arachidicoccus soli]AYD48697.1 dihydrofolate reductase [Arachidicoccus soli]
MNISMIVAAAENNAIGKNNQMLWHMPNDFKYFKNQTWGMPILMGRRTYQALNSKALPGRLNIVLTRGKEFKTEDAIVINKVEDAIFIAQEHDYNELMVIGGAEIYKLMLPKSNKIHLTRIHTTFEDADAFFPELNEKEWQLSSKQDHSKDDRNPYDYSFEIWERK